VRHHLLLAGLGAAALLGGVPVAAADDAARPVPDGGPWDEVVFLPESGLSVLLERDPKGVLLDRATYLDLHRRARASRGDLSAAPGGWKALVARGEVEATVEGERVRARLRLSVAVHGGGRESVLLPAGGAVTAATLDGAPATLGASADGKSLLLSVQGEGFHDAVIDLVAPVDRKAGTRSVAMALPEAMALRWSLVVPGRVTATAGAAAWRAERLENPDRTRIVGYPGPKAPALRASWREGDEGTDLPAMVGGAVRTLVEVGERSLSIQTLLRIQVQRRPEARFPVALPAGLLVLGVDSETPVSFGDRESAPGVRDLVFPEPFTGTRTVVIRATRLLDGPGVSEVRSPVLAGAAGLDRRLAVRFVDGLRGIVDAGEGVVREEAVPDPKLGAVDAVFRLTGGGDERVTVRTERPSARVEADLRAVVDLAEDGPWIAVSFLYKPRGDRLYGVEPRLPAGFTPDAITVSGDVSHLRSLSPDGRLSVVFPGGIEPGGAVAVMVRGRLPVEGWTAEDWTEKTVPFPRLDPGPVDGAEGRLGVAAPPDLEVREEDAAGMEPAAVSELRERAGFTTEGLTLGYRFRGAAPGGSVKAVRRPSSVTATIGLVASPEEDHLRYEAAVTLSVQRSGIREARIVVRPGAGDDLRVEGPDVAERRRIAGNGFDTWVVRFSRRVRDRTVVLLRADLRFAGGAVAVPMPGVEGAARQDLLVGLEGGGELEVFADAKGLREADPADLAGAMGPRAAGLLDAWKGERGSEPSLSVKVARLDAAALPPAYADGVSLSTVLGLDGIARTRVTARVRNADRQALEVGLPAHATLLTARVRGEAVRPLVTGEGRLRIPLVRSPEPFEVVLVYEEEMDPAGGAAALRAPDIGLPGGASDWTVRLPDGSVAVETSGDFAALPRPPATPILVRFLQGLAGSRLGLVPTAVSRRPPDGESGAFVELEDADGLIANGALPAESPAPAPAPPKKAMRPARGRKPGGAKGLAAEGGAEEEPAADEKAKAPAAPPAAAATPAPELKAGERMAARAAREGLFGMDVRLLEAGPAVVAARLSPGGVLGLSWRTATARRTGILLAGFLAFLGGWLARRRGVGAPTWTLLALALATAAPMVLGTPDAAVWDGAALGTLAWAAVSVVCWSHRKGLWLIRGRAPAAAAVLALALLALAPAASAQDAKKAAKPRPAPGPTAEAPVFVPYDPARPETLRTPERVFLPYARYVELWNAAHPEERIEPARPPVVAGAAYRARVEGRILVVEAEYEVDPGDGGLVPLPPAAAVEDLLVDGKPASAASLEAGGAVVVPVARAAKAGERRKVTATLRFPVEGREPGGVVRAAIPAAARARLTASLPLLDPVVVLRSEGGWTAAADGGATKVEADLGPATALDLSWAPRGADASGGRVRFEAATVEDLVLRETHAVLAARVALEVRSGTLEAVDLALPAGWEPESVTGPAVASWTASGEGADRRLRVRLADAGPGATEILVRAVAAGPALGAVFAAPDLAASGAATESVTIRVASGAGWRLSASEASAFDRVEAGEADAAAALDPARGERVQAAWRRARLPARLALKSEALSRSLETRSRQHLFLGAGFSLLRADLDLVPGPEGLFEAALALPPGWTLEDSEGGAAFPADGRVRIVLAGPAAAPRTLGLRLRGPAAGEGAFPFPRVRVEGAQRATDELLVSTAPAFAATAAASTGLEPVPVDRFSGWPALDPAERRALAFRAPRGGGDLSLRREALRPTVRPTVVADVTVLDDRAIVDALIVWDVRGGPAGTFRFRSPAGVKDAWVIGDGLREVRTALADGRETTTVTLQAPATGEVLFRVLYEVPVPAGGEAAVAGPEPLDGDSPRAFLFVRVAGDAEARIGTGPGGETPGLERCDAADLPLLPAGLDPRRVLRFFRARDAGWHLPLRLVSHETGAIPEARIHLVEAVTVVDRDGSSRTRVDARLFNRARAFLPVETLPGTRLESVVVGGVPVRPVTKKEMPGVVLVPVRRQSLGDESQVVSLTFAAPAAAPGGRFDALAPRLPDFPGVPVDATTWRVLLPEDRAYSFAGNLDPVEEVEVEMARAEAYASDVARLRKVVAEGSASQQTLAGQNIFKNTEELRKTLDRAQSRMGELEQAAAEGRVDQARVAESRRKAQDLTREIDEALKEVKDKAPALAAIGDVRSRAENVPSDARMPEEPPAPEKADVADNEKLATKEGQAAKQWRSNKAMPQRQEQERGRQQAELAANSATLKKAEESTVSAYARHQDFDRDLRSDVLLVQDRITDAGKDGAEDAEAHPKFGKMEEGAPVSGSGAGGDGNIGVGGGGAGGGHQYGGKLGGRRGGGGAGAAAAGADLSTSWFVGEGRMGAVVNQGDSEIKLQAGVISLAPPLDERGRTYAFRKLDAGAELTVSPGALGLGRRFGALAAFVLLAALVYFVRRRRAA
jgi:hypothetical protein